MAQEFEITIAVAQAGQTGGPAGAVPPTNFITEGDEIERRADALKALFGSGSKQKITELIGDADAITITIAKAPEATLRL